jgi:hypothetical protein
MVGLDPVTRHLVPVDEPGESARWAIQFMGVPSMAERKSIVPVERIEKRIYFIRGQKVMLDSDLAELYGVTTGALNQAVKRNRDRFPLDFRFELTVEEAEDLKSQSVISSSWGGRRRSSPTAFTEQGVAMLSSVLKSRRAVQVNVEIMRTFVRLREMLASNANLSRKLDELERKYDQQFKIVFDAIRQLMIPPEAKQKKPIGYHTEKN